MRDTTHEYVCGQCGVAFKGRANARGEVVASNAAPSGEARTCVCLNCEHPELTPADRDEFGHGLGEIDGGED
jgi:hypothetical protein